MADRFYCPGPWSGGLARLEGDEARHLARVRRVGLGEMVELFDGEGRLAEAQVVSLGRDEAELTILNERPDLRCWPGPIVVATAVPKGDRFDWLVEKATELGVTRLVPLQTERSVVDPRSTKLDRLRRLVVEASKQSGRARLMTIDRPTAFDTWRQTPGPHYLAHPTGARLQDVSRPNLSAGFSVSIGPEGGFTDAEVASAEASGFAVIGLGPTLLRIETAAMAACVGLLSVAESESRGT